MLHFLQRFDMLIQEFSEHNRILQRESNHADFLLKVDTNEVILWICSHSKIYALHDVLLVSDRDRNRQSVGGCEVDIGRRGQTIEHTRRTSSSNRGVARVV